MFLKYGLSGEVSGANLLILWVIHRGVVFNARQSLRFSFLNFRVFTINSPGKTDFWVILADFFTVFCPKTAILTPEIVKNRKNFKPSILTSKEKHVG